MLKTVKCKLIHNKEEFNSLMDTYIAVNNVCNYISKRAFDKKLFNRVGIHHLVYHDLRKRFNLPSSIVITSIGKVVNSYADKKKRKTQHIFKNIGAIDYDHNGFTIKSNNTFSIATLNGRLLLSFKSKDNINKYIIRKGCQLWYDKIKKNFYINLVVDVTEEKLINVTDYLGIDLGVVNLATCSDGEVFSGDIIEKNRIRIKKLRNNLQKCCTKSAKRHLKKISKKESLFKKDVNHCISKKIVEKVKALHCGIKLEDLTGIREKNPVKSYNQSIRDLKDKMGKWAFFQLRTFITYKAKIEGIPVLLINPAYTSQKCSNCGYTDPNNRVTQSDFVCKSCGFDCNADLNAAINISRAVVNQPIVAVHLNLKESFDNLKLTMSSQVTNFSL